MWLYPLNLPTALKPCLATASAANRSFKPPRIRGHLLSAWITMGERHIIAWQIHGVH